MRFMLVENSGPCPCGKKRSCKHNRDWHIVDTVTGASPGYQGFTDAVRTAAVWEDHPPKLAPAVAGASVVA